MGIALQDLPILSPDVIFASGGGQKAVSKVILGARKQTSYRVDVNRDESDVSVQRTGLQFTCYPIRAGNAIAGWVNVGEAIASGKPGQIPTGVLEQSLKPMLFHMGNLVSSMQGMPLPFTGSASEANGDIASIFATAIKMSRISKKSQQMIRSIIKNIEDVGDLEYEEEDIPSPPS